MDAQDFPMIDRSAWRTRVEKSLRGKTFDSLATTEIDGLVRQPLYSKDDVSTHKNASGGLGVFPYLRGRHAQQTPWHIGQRIMLGRAEYTNDAVLEDLNGGASAIVLDCSQAQTAPTSDDLTRLLDGVLLDAIQLILLPEQHGIMAINALADYLKQTDTPPERIHGTFGYEASQADLPALLEHTRAFPTMKWLSASGVSFHEQGATTTQELALALTRFTAHLRALETHGITPAKAYPHITIRLAAETDFFMNVAKFRAMRGLLAQIARACTITKPPPPITAETSQRNYTLLDSSVNILRGTVAGFGAALGGADVLTIAPASAASTHDTEQARRIARNTQIILQEESHIGRVTDPAGGSWYIESLTRDLATRAWELFQSLEKSSDPARIDDMLAKTRASREAHIATRRTPIVGVSEYPHLTTDPIPTANKAQRDSAMFEALRLAAEPARPKVFLAVLGASADYTPRVNFATNIYAIGGVRAVSGDASDFPQSGAKIAVICGSDSAYADHAAEAAKALANAGATHIALAGKPTKIANVDAYCFAGCDVRAFLLAVHSALGIGEKQ